jgi:isopenicillin N synthase-like dioxygenase
LQLKGKKNPLHFIFSISNFTSTNQILFLLLDIFSEVVGKYTQELNKLAHEILEMLCEGLGLNQGYFIGGLSENPQVLAHHYPPCPDPSLTLGLAKHRDPTIITILLQDQEVHGLQVLKDDEWIPVEPIPNAFVVNIGLILQVKSTNSIFFHSFLFLSLHT